MGWGLGLGVGV